METFAISDLSVLLIEPSNTQAKIIEHALQNQGVQNIEIVILGQEALKTIDKYPPDLIVSSMYLSDMTATEVITSLRHLDEPRDNIPFILISSEHHFGLLDPIKQAGVAAMLPKPFTENDLSKALATAVQLIETDEIVFDSYDPDDLNILIVDDSPLACKHLSKTLENIGLSNFTIVHSGQDALDLIEDQLKLDIILTDLYMPGMNGQQLTEHIRKDLGNTLLPIILITSETDKSLLNEIRKAGVSAICSKPFNPQELKRIVTDVLEN
ncbi:MAG: response regulator [Methylococcaceae bacterium]